MSLCSNWNETFYLDVIWGLEDLRKYIGDVPDNCCQFVQELYNGKEYAYDNICVHGSDYETKQ